MEEELRGLRGEFPHLEFNSLAKQSENNPKFKKKMRKRIRKKSGKNINTKWKQNPKPNSINS